MEELLKEYKRISEKILYEIMKGDLESAEKSIKVRGDILNKLSSISINKNIDIISYKKKINFNIPQFSHHRKC